MPYGESPVHKAESGHGQVAAGMPQGKGRFFSVAIPVR
jgi:hypothetical protein